MKITKNDPKLTAYLLKELSEAEMKLIAEKIKHSDELQAEVSRLQKNILQLKELKPEQNYRLSAEQREKIFAQTTTTSVWGKYLKLASGLAVASLALIVYVRNENDLESTARKKSAYSDLAEAPPATTDTDVTTPAAAEVATEQEAPATLTPSPTKIAQNAEPSEKPVELAKKDVSVDSAEFKKEELHSAPTSLGAFAGGAAGVSAGAAAMKGASAAAFGSSGNALNKRSAKMKMTNESDSMAAAGSNAVKDFKPPVVYRTEQYTFTLVDLDDNTDEGVTQAVAQPILSCFESSLSRYTKYNLQLIIAWKAERSMVFDYSVTKQVSEGPQSFTGEITCIERTIKREFKDNSLLSGLKKGFRFSLNLRSN